LDISYDGRYLITGGKDFYIKIWDIKKNKAYFTLKHHKKQINTLKFKTGSYEFYSGSEDG